MKTSIYLTGILYQRQLSWVSQLQVSFSAHTWNKPDFHGNVIPTTAVRQAQKEITTMHWCSVLHWARTHGNKNNQSLEPFHLSFWEAACMKQHKQLPSASVYQYGHYISQSPPQLQQNKGSSREEGWHGAGATCRLSLHLLWSTLDPTPILSQRNSIRPAPRVSLTLTFYPGTCWRCEK